MEIYANECDYFYNSDERYEIGHHTLEASTYHRWPTWYPQLRLKFTDALYRKYLRDRNKFLHTYNDKVRKLRLKHSPIPSKIRPRFPLDSTMMRTSEGHIAQDAQREKESEGSYNPFDGTVDRSRGGQFDGEYKGYIPPPPNLPEHRVDTYGGVLQHKYSGNTKEVSAMNNLRF
jgi:hypothetical protein